MNWLIQKHRSDVFQDSAMRKASFPRQRKVSSPISPDFSFLGKETCLLFQNSFGTHGEEILP